MSREQLQRKVQQYSTDSGPQCRESQCTIAYPETILQKEIEHCHFQNTVLQHQLSLPERIEKSFVCKLRWPSCIELCTSSEPLPSAQESCMTEDSWADHISDGQLLMATV